ncbi:MAG: ABC-2 transporter permease [Chloroflexi bacterium]|nr:ABC-2 transporter permease [Chloroflexota bacterium]
MDFKRIRSLALRVIYQMLGDRRTLALIVFVPIILLTLLSVLIEADESQVNIAVVNSDRGIAMGSNEVNLGQRLLTVLDDNDMLDVKSMSLDDANNKLEEGEIDAVIIVAEDFTQQVVQTQSLELTVRYEGSNPAIAENLDEIFERSALMVANTLVATQSGPGTTPVSFEREMETSLNTSYLHGGPEYDSLDFLAPALIGFFVFLFVFILTSISFLRERVAGTLERLLATPIRSHEVIIGYMMGFLIFGLIQGAVTLLFTVFVIDINYTGNLLNVFLVEILLVIVSVNLGIFLSTFAQNEFQVLQFLPLIVVTQGVLGGVVWQVENMPEWLQPLSQVMPLTYATDALREVMLKGANLLDVAVSLLILLAFGVGAIVLSAWSVRQARI